MDPYRAKLKWAHIELSQPNGMLSQVSSGPCRDEWTQVHVKLSRLGTRRVGSNPGRVESAEA